MVAAKAKQAVEDLDYSAERILRELTRGAFFDVRTLYAKDGTLLPMHKWPDAAAAAVVSVESVESAEETPGDVDASGRKKPGRVKISVRKVKAVDKVKCLELLGRHRKLFTDLTESTVKVSLEDLVAGSE